MDQLSSVSPELPAVNSDSVATWTTLTHADTGSPRCLAREMHPDYVTFVYWWEVLCIAVVIEPLLRPLTLQRSSIISRGVQGLQLRVSHGQKSLASAPKKRCAGLVLTPSVGVFLQSKSARYSDCPDSRHFVKRRFVVLTAFSAFPFDCG